MNAGMTWWMPRVSDAFVSVIDDRVLPDGYVETLRFLNEQSLSFDYHRYGNPGRRAVAE